MKPIDAAIRLAIILTSMAIIEAICDYGYVDPLTLVPPSRIFSRLTGLISEKDFWRQAQSTVRNIALATLVAWALGLILGVALHHLHRLRVVIEPLIASYYALPFFVFYPLAVVVLGMNDCPIILMAALFAVVSMIASSLVGLDHIPAVLGKTIKAFRLGSLRATWFVVLPAVAPHIFAGMKLALGYSVAGVIASEFILSNSGLGYSIAFAYNSFDGPTMYAYIVFVILLVSVVLTGVGRLERLLQYRPAANWTVTNARVAVDGPLAKALAWSAIAGLILLAWQGLHLLAGAEAIASPAATWWRLDSLIGSERFWTHAGETSRALILSFVLSVVTGIMLGVLMAAQRRIGDIVEPFVIALQSIPKVTLYPIILLLFGLGLSAKIAFGVLHGFIPMTLIALSAVRSINPALLRTARALRLSFWQRVTTVQIPAVLPDLVTGVRLAFSITFLGVMVGELFASKRGLGFLIMNSIAINDVSTTIAVTTVVGAVALIANVLLLMMERRMHR